MGALDPRSGFGCLQCVTQTYVNPSFALPQQIQSSLRNPEPFENVVAQSIGQCPMNQAATIIWRRSQLMAETFTIILAPALVEAMVDVGG